MTVLAEAPTDEWLCAEEVCRLTGVTYRQLEHWCNVGYLGATYERPGSGFPRRFTLHDVEVVDAVRALRSLGCRSVGNQNKINDASAAALEAAIAVMRHRRVEAGEWLIVTLDPPRARRMISASLVGQAGALWAVPLRSAEDLTS